MDKHLIEKAIDAAKREAIDPSEVAAEYFGKCVLTSHRRTRCLTHDSYTRRNSKDEHCREFMNLTDIARAAMEQARDAGYDAGRDRWMDARQFGDDPVTSEQREKVTQLTLIPDGMAWDDLDRPQFAVTVQWCGPFDGQHGGGYAIRNAGSELSTSGKWEPSPPRFRRWQFRWEHLDSALHTARAVVNELTVNGRTWAEWEKEK